ncbi:MAG: lipopolysaccharide biosynthesis protein [Ramlibacter sp.]|nr:lipopolysaccharide biosynthesis protein [Ramlibacter sp.]
MLLAGPYRPFWTYVRGLRSNAVALNSAYTIGSYVSMAVLQGLQFFLLARALGSHEFGIVASVVAITSAFLPFCSLGLGNVAIMHLTRGQARAEQSLGNGLAVTTITAAAGVALSLLVGWAFLNEPGVLRLVLLFALSEILLSKYVDLAAHVFLGLERQLVAAFFYNFQMFVRTGCAVMLYLGWTQQTALAWAQLHLAGGALSAVLVLCISVRRLGRPRTQLAAAIADIRKGVFFSILYSARSVHTDVDKIVLARLASASTAGTYTAAFRLVSLTCLPITAILFSLQARIFRKGHKRGLIGTVSALRQLLFIASAYCLFLGAAIYVGAPAVPLLLGESYGLTTDILRWLCLLPFFVVLQLLGSAALSGADAQPRVSLLHALTAALALLLNLLLVPGLGWRGAVIAAYGAQGFLIAGLAYTIMTRVQAERKAKR